MAGPFALHAEVFGGLHDAGSEVHLPEAVHRHPSQKRIARIDQPLRKAEAVVGSPGGKRGQNRRHARLYFFSRHVVGSANQHEGVFPSGPLGHHHHGGEAALEFLFFQSQSGETFPGVLNFRRRSVLKVIPANCQLLDLASLRFRFCRDVVDRFTKSQGLDLLTVEQAPVNAHIVDPPAEPSLWSASTADAERLVERFAGVMERTV